MTCRHSISAAGGAVRFFRMIPVFLIPAFLLVAAPSVAGPPLIFDFEDLTTQGWDFGPTTFLVGTEGLFDGERSVAVFGFDQATMSITLDLTDVATMTWEEFDPTRPPGPRDPNSRFAVVSITPGATPPHDFITGPLVSPTNPSTRTFDLTSFTGLQTIQINWESLAVPLDAQFELVVNFPGYIDEIVLLPVPEPAALPTMGLLVLVLVRALHHPRKGHPKESQDRQRCTLRIGTADDLHIA